MIYIDFDGVILDTEDLIFEEWKKNPNRYLLPQIEKIRYLQSLNWKYILENSKVINDAIYNLNNMDPTNTFVLTKIHSQNEGVEKVLWLRDKKVKQSIILVPYKLKKVDVVDAKNNVLIDDCLYNLRDWEDKEGNVVFFDKDDDDYDSWHQKNIRGYQKTMTLSKIPFESGYSK